MNRRSFLRKAGGAATASWLSPLLSPAAPSSRPNVLFLSCDDMNDWVGCLGGYPGAKTPNIDRLARRGALFANTHCAAPLCNPSRTALLTGRRPSNTGIYDNDQFWKPALPGVVTIPMYFKQQGYHTAGAGKVFHHTSGFNPPDQWDDYFIQVFDDPWYRRLEWYPWVKKIPNPEGHPFNGLKNFPGEFDWGVIPGRPENEYGDAKAVQFAQQFLAQKHDKPFFLAVGLWHPHIPMFAPQEYFDLYPRKSVRLPEVPGDDLDDIPATGQKLAAFRRDEHERIVQEGKWVEAVQAYLACLSFADTLVGQVLDALEQSPYAANTLIVFWSDNGWHLGEKRHWHKSTLWERSTHVPMIIAGPGVQATGTSRMQTVSLLDLYPTLVDYCKLPRRNDLDGTSLMPLLRDPNHPHDPVVSTMDKGNHCVRSTKWRYIRYHDGGEELYDREKDPNEWHNLAGDPQYRGTMNDLARYLPKTNADPKPGRTDYDFDYATYTYKLKKKS